MTREKCWELFEQICNKYRQEMWIHAGDPGRGNGACSYIIRREIILPQESIDNPGEWDVLMLLHEIGHIKTNSPKMKTYEKEYHAVQWSAREAKRIGLNVREEWRKAYQEYIWKKRELSIKLKGKNVADREALMVSW